MSLSKAMMTLMYVSNINLIQSFVWSEGGGGGGG